MNWNSIRAIKICHWHFLLASAFIILLALGVHYYVKSFVYVVSLGDRELGVVEDVKEIEPFVETLTQRCSDLYGMNLALAEKVTLARELRPDDIPSPEKVREMIRQHANFTADAYIICVDEEPFAPISSAEDLDEVTDSIKAAYISKNDPAKVLEATILEELTVQKFTAPPEEILTPEEIVKLLKEDKSSSPLVAADIPDEASPDALESRYYQHHDYYLHSSPDPAEKVPTTSGEVSTINDVKVQVQTVEELVVIEKIPFQTEHVYDENMLTTETEITTPGREGEKEIVYHLVRKNGVEIERTLISEEIQKEPRDQVETIGLKEPPKVGRGQFVWPVQGKGTIYNGFSSRHQGIDIHIAHGTNVLAADDGLVACSDYGSTQGNYLILYHGDYWTLYLHNSENLVSKGERVSRGQVIARVGTTGRAFGPHLHFEVRVDDGTGKWHTYYQHQAVDPLQFFNR